MLPVRHSPAHDAPDPRLEEVSHLGLPEAVLVPVAPHVTDVVDDAASTTVEPWSHVGHMVSRAMDTV